MWMPIWPFCTFKTDIPFVFLSPTHINFDVNNKVRSTSKKSKTVF